MSSAIEFSEESIRPQRFNDGKRSAAAEDIKYLKGNSEKFVDTDCPACDSGLSKLKFVKETFSYNSCLRCGTLYMSPRPSDELLNSFYRQSKLYAYWNEYIFPASESSRNENIFKPRVDRVAVESRKYLTRFDRFLEVGAGYGTFSNELRSRGLFKEIDSLELTPSLAESCRRRGLNVIEKSVEELSVDDYYDAIASFETLEHLFSPRDFIRRCGRMLRSKGVLFMSMPSCEGFDVQVLGASSSSIDHEHINLFNPSSISRLLTDEGFRVLDVFTPGEIDIDIVRNKVSEGFVIKDEFLEKLVMSDDESVRLSFQVFLKENLRSSHMWVIAQKANE